MQKFLFALFLGATSASADPIIFGSSPIGDLCRVDQAPQTLPFERDFRPESATEGCAALEGTWEGVCVLGNFDGELTPDNVTTRVDLAAVLAAATETHQMVVEQDGCRSIKIGAAPTLPLPIGRRYAGPETFKRTCWSADQWQSVDYTFQESITHTVYWGPQGAKFYMGIDTEGTAQDGSFGKIINSRRMYRDGAYLRQDVLKYQYLKWGSQRFPDVDLDMPADIQPIVCYYRSVR